MKELKTTYPYVVVSFFISMKSHVNFKRFINLIKKGKTPKQNFVYLYVQSISGPKMIGAIKSIKIYTVYLIR